jgi:hypothetical protein
MKSSFDNEVSAKNLAIELKHNVSYYVRVALKLPLTNGVRVNPSGFTFRSEAPIVKGASAMQNPWSSNGNTWSSSSLKVRFLTGPSVTYIVNA